MTVLHASAASGDVDSAIVVSRPFPCRMLSCFATPTLLVAITNAGVLGSAIVVVRVGWVVLWRPSARGDSEFWCRCTGSRRPSCVNR